MFAEISNDSAEPVTRARRMKGSLDAFLSYDYCNNFTCRSFIKGLRREGTVKINGPLRFEYEERVTNRPPWGGDDGN
jgi:hypothetical protein